MLRSVRIAGWTMIWSGVLILSYVGYQLVGTDFVAARDQEVAREVLPQVLEERRAELDVSEPEAEEPEIEAPVEPEPVLLEEGAPQVGEILGVVRIPKIEVDQVLYEGVDRETLKLGPGRIPGTAVPGQPGNAAISGHRTTYGRPFFDLDLLVEGDIVEVETAIGVHSYAVRSFEIVAPTDVWVLDPRPGAWLTLTTCNPKWSARERLVVFAELVDGPNFEYVDAA